MIKIVEFSKKSSMEIFVSSDISTALSETICGSIPHSFKIANFSIEVVEPFTKNPFSNNDLAKGNPNQPQPKMLICFIYAELVSASNWLNYLFKICLIFIMCGKLFQTIVNNIQTIF